MTEGMLTCAYVRGERESDIRGTSLLFDPKQSLISRAFIDKKPLIGTASRDSKGTVEAELEAKFGIKSSTIIPILQDEEAIGVICVDSGQEEETLSREQLKAINKFLEAIAPSINIARKYHQQILLGKQVDEVKKREAAFRMVRSAVKLVDKLCLASVLVPGEMSSSREVHSPTWRSSPLIPEIRPTRTSTKIEARSACRRGDSLFSHLVSYDGHQGVLCQEEFASPLYYPDVKKDLSQRRLMAERIGLCLPLYRASLRSHQSKADLYRQLLHLPAL